MSHATESPHNVPILDNRHRLPSPAPLHQVLRRIDGELRTNCKIEYFSDFTKFTVADVPIFKERGWEADKKRPSGTSKPQNCDNAPEVRSMNRAKGKIFNIAALNPFDYFITWTLDKSKIDREDSTIISKRLKIFLSNMVNRNNLSYLIVPEYHKDGKAIHFHGLLSGNLRLVDSGKRLPDGRTIYNMPQWSYGFSTCVELAGSRGKVANYITKYITKDTKKILGNFYYAGGHLIREPDREFTNLPYDSIEAAPHYVPELGINFKYVTVEGGLAQ